MKKFCLDLTVSAVDKINEKYVLIRLTDDQCLPDMMPGQFVEVRVDNSPSTFLRRPISINFVDREHNEMWLLVAAIGDGTRRLAQLKAGEKLNCMFPLGNGFTGSAGEKGFVTNHSILELEHFDQILSRRILNVKCRWKTTWLVA
jgi:dihydroorotate dehydrogenase electron transfer subunit